MKKLFAVMLVGVLIPTNAAASEATLRGSKSAMERQNRIARENDFTFLRTPKQIRSFVEAGRLTPLEGNANYRVEGASFPYARPEVTIFVERLGAQHRAACGQPLVVTSATRPSTKQPRNASPLSVHPAGMAVDLRISNSASCRAWLEHTLLQLEARTVLDVTRERTPPHYHVAIFPHEYMAYVEVQLADSIAVAERVAAERRAAAEAALAAAPAASPTLQAGPGTKADSDGKSTGWAVLFSVLAFMAGAPMIVRWRQRVAAEPALERARE